MNDVISRPRKKPVSYNKPATEQTTAFLKKPVQEKRSNPVIQHLKQQQQHVSSALLVCGLLALAFLYMQTGDIILKEGFKALAVVLLLCQLKVILQPTKQS